MSKIMTVLKALFYDLKKSTQYTSFRWGRERCINDTLTTINWEIINNLHYFLLFLIHHPWKEIFVLARIRTYSSGILDRHKSEYTFQAYHSRLKSRCRQRYNFYIKIFCDTLWKYNLLVYRITRSRQKGNTSIYFSRLCTCHRWKYTLGIPNFTT